MKLGEGVEWGLHCVTLLAMLPPDSVLSAAQLAEFHGIPQPYLSKALQALSRAGITTATGGRTGGYRLARQAHEVTMLHVVEAIDGGDATFRCTEIRRRGPSRTAKPTYTPVCAIATVMYRADEAWRDVLTRTTLADIVDDVARTSTDERTRRAVTWLTRAIA